MRSKSFMQILIDLEYEVSWVYSRGVVEKNEEIVEILTDVVVFWRNYCLYVNVSMFKKSKKQKEYTCTATLWGSAYLALHTTKPCMLKRIYL